MRILVHEFVSGGGFAGRPVPASLAREGAAMRDALVEDLARLDGHGVVTTADRRFPLRRRPDGVEVVTLASGSRPGLDEILGSVDAAWLVAPETDGCLERLAARAARQGKLLLGPDAAAIRSAADKARLPSRLAREGIPHPATRAVGSLAAAKAAAEAIGFPVVVKPARGAGCGGVSLARNPRELRTALEAARRASRPGSTLIQRYVRGIAASVSLLADGRSAVALAVNRQSMRGARPFVYRGGTTPLDHPLAGRAAAVARRVCEALPGLKGYVGVDLVLTDAEAVVIEVNPRLTTAYLGIRATLDANLAGLALAACAGCLPAPPSARRRVSFTSAGRIVSA